MTWRFVVAEELTKCLDDSVFWLNLEGEVIHAVWVRYMYFVQLVVCVEILLKGNQTATPVSLCIDFVRPLSSVLHP